MLKKNKKIIYYWASNEENNNGEGFLAKNYLIFIKKNFKNYKLQPINNFNYSDQNTLFYKYLVPLIGALILWKYYIKNQKISYINYLPAWNIILILLLPPKTIIGPVSGSVNRDKFNLLILILSYLGIKILKYKYKKIIFSHDLLRKITDKNNDDFYFNFLLYKFKLERKTAKKKFDFIFYLREHSNKRNTFSINLIKNLSKKFKICIIGKNFIKRKNIYNQGYVTRNKALKLIAKSRFAVSGYENLYSYFWLHILDYKYFFV